MEEYLTKKIVTKDLDETIKTYEVFDWKVANKDILGYKTLVTFSRDTEEPHYAEIKALEKKWNKEMSFPAWPTYLFIALAILTITAYLIVSILTGFEDKLIYFLSIMMPGLGFFIIGTLFFIIRTKKIEKIIVKYYERRHDYALEAKRIKGEE